MLKSAGLYFSDASETDIAWFEAMFVRLDGASLERIPDRATSEKRWRQHILSRCLARYAVSAYSGRAAFKIAYPENASPKVPDHPFYLSLSHCSGAAAISISANGPIGCDILSNTRARHWRSITRHFFSAPEKKFLEGLDDETGLCEFARLWCVKEAFAKRQQQSIFEWLGQNVLKAMRKVKSECHVGGFGDTTFAVVCNAPQNVNLIMLTPRLPGQFKDQGWNGVFGVV